MLSVLIFIAIVGQAQAAVIAVDPDPYHLGSRFSGAVLMLRHRSPVADLSQYHIKLFQLKENGSALPDGFEAEYSRAVATWDVWDDLRTAVMWHDAGDVKNSRRMMQAVRRKLGPVAYARGAMPSPTYRAFWFDEFGSLIPATWGNRP